MSIVEPSRRPEDFWHVWRLPPELQRDDARAYFIEHVKPAPYTFERFYYNPKTGIARTI